MSVIRWSDIDHQQRLDIINSRIWFGTQYYRPPHPPAEHWESDFRQMRQTGLEVVRLWLYWRWMERRPGRFFWDDTDRLFDLAEANGLYIHPLIFLESVPEWFIQEHPETWMVDQARQAQYPLNRKSTQIGGMAVCGNHPVAKEWGAKFLHQVVLRYKGRPSLMCWDVWNELQVKSVGSACACEFCISDYRQAMREAYGTVEAYNVALRGCLGDWQDLQPPNGASDYAAWFSWRRWQARSLSRQAIWRKQIIQQADPRQVVMIHMPTKLAIPGKGCGDWDACVPQMDFAGNSTHIQHAHSLYNPADMYLARGTLCAEHRITAQQSPHFGWACEVSSDSGNVYAPPELPGDDLAYWVWKPLSMGLRGVFLWQYRPETYGPEALDLGLIDGEDGDSPRRRTVQEIIQVVRRNDDIFSHAHPPRPQVGILMDTDQHLASAMVHLKVAGGNAFYQRCVLRLHDIARQAGLPVAFVQPGAIAADIRLLLVPHALASPQAVREALLEFLSGGGTAVMDGGLLNPAGPSFQYGPITPGAGLADILGVTEGRQTSTHWYGMTPGEGQQDLRTAQEIDDAWLDEGHEHAFLEVDKLQPQLRIHLKWNEREYACSAGFDRRPIRACDADIIGWFGDGAPAVATRKIGAGRVFYFGTAASYAWATVNGGFDKFVRDLAHDCGIAPPLPLAPTPGLTWHVLESGARKLLFLFNHSQRPAEISLDKIGPVTVLFGKGKQCNGKVICNPLTTTVLAI